MERSGGLPTGLAPRSWPRLLPALAEGTPEPRDLEPKSRGFSRFWPEEAALVEGDEAIKFLFCSFMSAGKSYVL